MFLYEIYQKQQVSWNAESNFITPYFASQSTPSLSERAPPEGQEDPPLHQSIISLTPSNADDDSNNNNSGTDISSDMWKCLPGEKQEQGVLSAAVVQRTNIIDGLRWEELTKMGHELLEKATTDPSILDSQQVTSTRALLSQEQLATGTRPKQKQLMAIKAEAQMQRDGMGRLQGRRSKSMLSSDERRRLYKKSFRKDKAPPSLYIPVKVEGKKFREEVILLFIYFVDMSNWFIVTWTEIIHERKTHCEWSLYW